MIRLKAQNSEETKIFLKTVDREIYSRIKIKTRNNFTMVRYMSEDDNLRRRVETKILTKCDSVHRQAS